MRSEGSRPLSAHATVVEVSMKESEIATEVTALSVCHREKRQLAPLLHTTVVIW